MAFAYRYLLTAAGLGLLAAGMAHAAPSAPVVKAVVPAGAEAQLAQAADMINASPQGSADASAVLNKAYAAEPQNALVFYLDAVNQFNGGHADVATTESDMAIQLDKTVAAYYYVRGVAVRYDPGVWSLDKQRATADDFKTAYTLDPNFQAAYRERASATMYLTELAPNYTPNYDGTVYDDIHTAVQLDPEDGEAHFIEGMENISDSDWQAARDELTKAAALGVTRSEVYENLGYADYKLKQKAQSAADYQKALEIDANNATATQNLAVLQSGDDLTWVPQTVDPWTQQMRDLDASYQGDVAAGLAIRDGGRAPGYGSADDYDDDEDDPGASDCNRAAAWWQDLHDGGLTLGLLIAKARSDKDKKTYGDLLQTNTEVQAQALQTWHDNGCT